MTPTQHYQQLIDSGTFQPDDAQVHAVSHTQRLYDELTTTQQNTSFFSSLLNRKQRIRGLYLWGGTGRGKTWLTDSFYGCLTISKKQRTHFHSFMRDIHHRLQLLPKTPDPLKIVAADLAQHTRLLCLDEFHVHDIGDAMIMAGLLEAIFDQGITLVATSNIATDDLYKNGLQRDRFMTTIELLKKYTDEVYLGHGNDYRFQSLEKCGTYYVGDTEEGHQFLQRHLDTISPCPAKHNREININNRPISYIAHADDVIWFDFEQICNTPRADSDYISIAEICHTVLISKVPYMHEEHDNIAKRFIHLIDALYDHQVKCIITAIDDPHNLYKGKALSKAFERTISRLIEMDSARYLALPHRIATT